MAKKRKPWWEQESSAFKETKKIYEEGRKEVLAKRDSADKKGVWRTVRGRHVFIEEGKTLEQALGHKPGVENQKKMDDPDKGLKKTSSEPYVRQAEKEAYRKKNPPMSAYEKMFQDLKRKNRKK